MRPEFKTIPFALLALISTAGACVPTNQDKSPVLPDQYSEAQRINRSTVIATREIKVRTVGDQRFGVFEITSYKGDPEAINDQLAEIERQCGLAEVLASSPTTAAVRVRGNPFTCADNLASSY